MTWWIGATQYATEALALVLILRLLLLRQRREGVYIVFVLFLTFQLLSSAEYFVSSRWFPDKIDYRLTWLFSTIIGWFFSLALVYSLSKAVLAGLPGVFRFSRILLNLLFPLAIVLALSTVRWEYWVTGAAQSDDAIFRILTIGHVVDRAISMAALLVLVAILAFILWFPVKMPRNLAVLSIGLVVYFGTKTGLTLLLTYSAPGTITRSASEMLSASVSLIGVFCFLYWIVFIDQKGQTSEVPLGRSWRSADQGRLVQQLESLNVALLRNSQRFEL
jgi:hypothetical protein